MNVTISTGRAHGHLVVGLGMLMLIGGMGCGSGDEETSRRRSTDGTDVGDATRRSDGGQDVSITCEQGIEGCDCYGNDTCNAGLTCVEGTCTSQSGERDAGASDAAPVDARADGETIDAETEEDVARRMDTRANPQPDGSSDARRDADLDTSSDAPPTVSFESLTDGDEVTGRVDIAMRASDDVSVASVEVTVDPSGSAAILQSRPFEWTWDTRQVEPGNYTLSATATDGTGQTASTSIEIEVGRPCRAGDDCIPSDVTFVTPQSGATLCGDAPLEVEAKDDRGIERVRVEVDGQTLDQLEDRPFQSRWDTIDESNGAHTLRATAIDASGQSRFAEIPVQIDNTVSNCDNRPTVEFVAPQPGAYLTDTTTAAVDISDDVGVTKVQWFLDGGLVESQTKVPYEFQLDTTPFQDGSHMLKAVAEDTSGQTASRTIEVTTDNTAPTVTLQSPSSSKTVLLDPANVEIEADASDNLSLEKVDLEVDASTTSVTSPPWRDTFDLSNVSGGETRTISARAVDRVGQTTTASRTVIIDRPPTVQWQAPPAGAALTSSTTLNVEARDERSLAEVRLVVSGQQVGTFEQASGDTYTYDWTPGQSQQGSQSLKAVAEDGEGQTTSATRSVDVQCSRTFYLDDDDDGYGDPGQSKGVSTCRASQAPSGYVDNDRDCDDSSARTYPGAAPEDSASACMKDADGDDWGDDDPPNGVETGTDCDDSDTNTYPGAPELQDDKDNDCDGDIDEGTGASACCTPIVCRELTRGICTNIPGADYRAGETCSSTSSC